MIGKFWRAKMKELRDCVNIFQMKIFWNKKVLLRECKRHTDRGVSCTPSVTWGGVPPLAGVPPPSQVWKGWGQGVPRWGTHCQGGTPLPGLTGVPKVGYPLARVPLQPHLTGGYQRWGTPWQGYPPSQVSWGLPEVGYPQQGYLPPGRGTPSPQVWTDKQSETITSRLVLRTRSVIKKI